MLDGRRSDLAARAWLTFATLLPYWQLLTFGVVYVPDDYFASDIFDGELPVRVLIGQLIRRGELPVWTSQLCSGLPLGGAASDPFGLAVFTLLPPAAALDLYVIVLLQVAAHGAYALARRFGADRFGAVLAGTAFAGSGYIACQLKHLTIVATVVWLPVGLLIIDRALGAERAAAPQSVARRALLLAVFGLVFAQQVLAGFPQSAYICALCYGAFALTRVLADRRRLGGPRVMLGLFGGLGLATALGSAAGAVVLLPMSELGSLSDRSRPLGYEWSTRLAYWPKNALTFLLPYVHGDISDRSYVGDSFFWEDYGYVGAAVFLLALYGAFRERRRLVVRFALGMTVLAYLFVLGKATPVFRVAYELIPGLSLFRFPTRFLIVVELGLALLGALGLARLRLDLQRRWPAPSRIPAWVAFAFCAGTAADLFVHQPRQNPMVPAREWLAPPGTVAVVRADHPRPRTFTPHHRDLHRRAFDAAHGWKDVQPYFELRSVLEPNTGGGLWNVASADCYAGIAPRWSVDLWGDHSREASLTAPLATHDFAGGTLTVQPGFTKLLAAHGVTHVLSPIPQAGAPFYALGRDAHAFVYRVVGATRARFVRAARHLPPNEHAAPHMLAETFDPDRELLLHDAPATVHPTTDELKRRARSLWSHAVVTHEDSRRLTLDVTAPTKGFLLLADTYYPGWTATVDGTPAPIYRANDAVRAIQLPKGRHQVAFRYEAGAYLRGLRISLLALALLTLWAAGACYAARRAQSG